MNIWGNMSDICKDVRSDTYSKSAIVVSHSQLQELERLLKLLPADDVSLVGAECAAIYFEGIGEISDAIQARRILLKRMLLLREDIEENDYSDEVRFALLDGYGEVAIQQCILAIQRLESLSDKGPMEHGPNQKDDKTDETS